MSLTVDVIIPVFRGESESRACLESVLGARDPSLGDVIVIDDASPEPRISSYLKGLADAKRIKLIAHETNRGFVASVNEGMAACPDRDVVLLNSDTDVAAGWLERLAAHAERDPGVG